MGDPNHQQCRARGDAALGTPPPGHDDAAESGRGGAPVRPPAAAGAVPPGVRRIGLVARVLALAAASLFLNLWGLSWGLPAVTSWAPDSAAGTRTLRTVGTWPDRWPARYPPLHFFVNRLAYAPMLAAWQRDEQMKWVRFQDDAARPVELDATPGDPGVRPVFVPPRWEKVGRLILVSRVIAALMSVAAVLVVAACGRLLFGHRVGGVLAGLALATCAEWVFFSHLGTVDIPHMFWFALSVYVYIAAWRRDRWWQYALLGVLAAMSVSTKDAVAGAYAGMACVLVVMRWQRSRGAGGMLRRAVATISHPNLIVGFASFALPYAVIHGLMTCPHVYVDRLRYYLAGPGTAAFNQAYTGPVWLAREALAEAAKALGWPMFTTMIASTAYGLVRWRRPTWVAIVPCVAYYFIVCGYTGIVYARILFPVYVLLVLPLGRCVVDWLAWTRPPVLVRYGAVTLLYASSFGYAVGVDLEMVHDTRYRAEAWIERHVAPGDTVGVFAPPQYLPRLFLTGRRAVRIHMSPASISSAKPDFVIVSSHNTADFGASERACLTELRAGRLGYQSPSAAHFAPLYLPPRRRWFAIAGWGTRGAGKASPTIDILARDAP
ncbi:MAG: ArnT family glycosyltransferase [Phycisphaerae bacterium]